MQEHKKLELLKSFQNEDELRTELIIPLFRKLGFQVYDNQSADEYGVDVILQKVNLLNHQEYTAIILKKGDIDNKSGRPTGILNTLRDQLVQAAKMPLNYPGIKKNCYPNNIYIITNGKISKSAKTVFHNMLKDQFEALANFEYIDNMKLVDLIDQHWIEFYNDRRPFLSQYAEKLKKEISGLDLSDMGNNGKDLDSVLIPQMLLQKANIDESDVADGVKRKLLMPRDVLSINRKVIFVTGEAGSGKSVLLKRMAVEAAEESKAVPIFITARKILGIKIKFDEIVATISDSECQVPEDEILNEVNESKIILLVDGLDEIRESSQRLEVVSKLMELSSEAKVEKIIISSRPENDQKTLMVTKGARSYQLQPVARSQVNGFFMKWFDNTAKANKLFEDLNRKSLLDRLPKTPLTLTLLAILYETKEDIPTTLTDLYRMFSELLLGKWDHKKGINTLRDSQIKFGLLSMVGWVMHRDGVGEISQEKLISIGEDYFKNKIGDDSVDVVRIVQDIIDRSGLFSVFDSKIKFKHFSFQEYFCSQEIYSKKVFGENIGDWIVDSWWEEVLFFSAGTLKNIDDYMDVLLQEVDDIEDYFVKLSSLGGMLQAAYETSLSNKTKIISYSVNKIPPLIKDAIERLKRDGDASIPLFVPYAAIVDIVSNNYASSYLEKPLSNVLSKLKFDSDQYDHDISLMRLFLSASMSKSGNVDGLLEVSDSIDVSDPIMLLLSDMLLSDYDEKYNDKKMSDLHKKVRKKITAVPLTFIEAPSD